MKKRSTLSMACAALVVTMLGAILAAACTSVFAAAPQLRTQAPGYYRMMVGDFEVTALLDGTHTFPVDDVMINANTGQVDSLLAGADLARPVEGSINAFLINTGTKLILIDSGAGVLYGDCCGHLNANLRAAGYTPEQVDEVYLTHLHQDHVGGVISGVRPAFPNAVVRMSKADAEYWLNSANKATAPSYLGPMFDGAITSLRPYMTAGRLKTFSDQSALTAGIHPVPAPGHTPGHTSYVVESRGQSLVVWGDIVHVAPVQFVVPGIGVKYDSDAVTAERERRQIFADAASKGYWVAAAHISFPGIGHIRLDGDHYQWIAAPYTTWLSPAAASKGK